MNPFPYLMKPMGMFAWSTHRLDVHDSTALQKENVTIA